MSHFVIVGPTASGKSALAHELARRSNGEIEIVSVDSMQVYRGMDIGTAKPSLQDQGEIQYHMIDLVEPSEEFSLAAFQEAAIKTISDIETRGHRALLVGGTGLYVQAVVDGLEVPGRYPQVREELEAQPDTWGLHAYLSELDPLGASRMERSNRRRIIRALEVAIGSGRPFSSFGPGLEVYPKSKFRMIGLRPDIEDLDRSIETRFRKMIEDGFVDEVAGLSSAPGGLSRTAKHALGYRELISYLSADITLEEAGEKTRLRTRQFARRQLRWFRRDPRIKWIVPKESQRKKSLGEVEQMLEDWVDE